MKNIKLKKNKDDRGVLIPVEFECLPFNPKRVFVVNNVPIGTKRGGHAHYKTKQVLICIKGSVMVYLHDGLKEFKKKIKCGQAIFISNLIWDTQEFLEEDSEILVICSTKYDFNDYIYDFEYFLNLYK